MKARTRGTILGLVALVVLGVVFFLVRSRGGGVAAPGDGEGREPQAGRRTEEARADARPGSTRKEGAEAPSPGGASGRGEVIAELAWGSGPSGLGHERRQEGNAEGPMSLAVDALGNVVVLDQTNGRLVRLDSRGKPVGTFPLTQQVPQDVTLARDGTVLVLDRLKDKSVALLHPDTGQLLGELPVEGKGIPEGGGVTGTFVDGDSVYVEREHGALVRIGDTSGQADPERPEIPGRPTRDGRSYLTAGIIDRQSGRVFVNVIDRQSGENRYTREYRLQFPLMNLNLLDTDRAGTIYLGVVGALPTEKAEPATQPGIRLYCLAPEDGRIVGQTELPLKPMPEETFRDLVVLDMGGVVYKQLTSTGVILRQAHCR